LERPPHIMALNVVDEAPVRIAEVVLPGGEGLLLIGPVIIDEIRLRSLRIAGEAPNAELNLLLPVVTDPCEDLAKVPMMLPAQFRVWRNIGAVLEAVSRPKVAARRHEPERLVG